MITQYKDIYADLSKLIAVEIFDWKCDHRNCNGEWRTRCGACGQEGHGNCYGNGRGAIQIACDHWPSFANNMGEAWKVVQKLEPVQHFAMDSVATDKFGPGKFDYNNGYQVIFGSKKTPTDVKVRSRDGEVAICLCALKSIGYSFEEIQRIAEEFIAAGVFVAI